MSHVESRDSNKLIVHPIVFRSVSVCMSFYIQDLSFRCIRTVITKITFFSFMYDINTTIDKEVLPH